MDQHNFPKVTIAILSYERFQYLKATLESARQCIEYPNLEWIVSDNQSREQGLRQYLETLDWVTIKLFQTQSHADAMNQIVSMATGEYLLLWPEDVQFIVQGDWLVDYVDILKRNPDIGSMALDCQRMATLESRLRPTWLQNLRRSWMDIRRYGWQTRRSRTCRSSRGEQVITYGAATEGICGSGIPSLTRTDLWRTLGAWRTQAPRADKLIDSSLGAEDDMIARFIASRQPLQMAAPLRPVAADIITDPLGCKAKVRGGKRYGVYMPPPDGLFYYRICALQAIPVPKNNLPLSFAELVKPIGFTIPTDSRGDRLKSSINPSVVYDLEHERTVAYPLRISDEI